MEDLTLSRGLKMGEAGDRIPTTRHPLLYSVSHMWKSETMALISTDSLSLAVEQIRAWIPQSRFGEECDEFSQFRNCHCPESMGVTLGAAVSRC